MTDIAKWWISLNDFWRKSIAVHIELMKIGITYDKILQSTKTICDEPIEDIYQNITGNEFKVPSIIEFEKSLSLPFFYIRSKDCSITDIQPLIVLNQLEIIDFSYNKVNDLSPIKNCNNLKILNCESNLIISLQPITMLNNLIELNCGRNEITNLVPLKDKVWLVKDKVWLVILKVDQNPIKSLNGVQNLTRLEYFDCSDDSGMCRIGLDDLNYLVNLKRLKRLKLDNPLLWNELSSASWNGQSIKGKLQAIFTNCEITY